MQSLTRFSAAVAITAALFATACGDDDTSNNNSSVKGAAGSGTSAKSGAENCADACTKDASTCRAGCNADTCSAGCTSDFDSCMKACAG